MIASRPIPLLIVCIWLFACEKPQKTNSVKEDPHRKVIFLKGYEHAASLYPSQKDSAFYYFAAIATNTKDSSLASAAYIYMGMILSDIGDYYGSQETHLQALQFLDDTQFESLISSYNGLGKNSLSLKDYNAALKYFVKALNLSKDDDRRITLLNNIGIAYRDKKSYNNAIIIFDSILQKSQQDPVQYAQILSNLAHAKWLRNNNYQAASDLLSALQIRQKEQDKEGLTASYGHLTDYYLRSKPDSAILYAQKMYNNAVNIGNPDDQLWALQKLVLLSTGKSSKDYFSRYLQLNDSLQTKRNNAKNQFALIRYETEKQKADNLVLQKENAETKLRVIWQRVISLIIGIGAITGFIWYRKRKRQAIKEQQLRISQKVHDVVANGLYRVMSKIEHDKAENKEQLLDEMGVLYEQSRNISYEQPEIIYGDFQQEIINLLQSFANDTTTVSIVGDSKELWDRLTPKIKKDLPLILQNLMTNMKRHSRAENVVLRLGHQKKQFSIHYTDDGIGLPPDFKYGKGLTNTEFRIHNLGGQLTFDYPTTKGAKINIYIPIAN